jgi:hypothetical protein
LLVENHLQKFGYSTLRTSKLSNHWGVDLAHVLNGRAAPSLASRVFDRGGSRQNLAGLLSSRRTAHSKAPQAAEFDRRSARQVQLDKVSPRNYFCRRLKDENPCRFFQWIGGSGDSLFGESQPGPRAAASGTTPDVLPHAGNPMVSRKRLPGFYRDGCVSRSFRHRHGRLQQHRN